MCLALLVAVALGQSPGGQAQYYTAATAAARELTRELDLLQRSFATIPGPPEGRGLYQQLDTIQLDQIYLRQQLERKAPRRDLYVAFDKLDGELNQLLGDIKDLSKWAPAVTMAIRRVRAAQHDVHVALAAGDEAPARQGDAAYRQVLAVEARAEDLDKLARYVFPLPETALGWKTDFAALRAALSELQRLQKDRAGRDDLKRQMQQVDRAWDKLVARYNDLPQGEHLLLRSDFEQFDRQLARLAPVMGVTQRRPPLKDSFGTPR